MTEVAEKNRNVHLSTKRMKTSTTVNNRWSVVLAPHMNYDDLMNPEFWSINGYRFTQGDIIEVRTDDSTHYGEFIVIACDRLYAKLEQLRWVELGNAERQSRPMAYEYKYKGPTWKHCVVRASDGEVMAKELATKDDAMRWIAMNSARAA